MIKFIIKYLSRYKFGSLLYTFFLILFTLASFCIPRILGVYIDSFTSLTPVGIYIIYTFILVALVETVSSYLNRYIRNKIANRITLDMIKDLTAHILKQPMSFFREQEVMYLSNRINSDSFNLGDFGLKFLSDVLISVISLIVVFVYIIGIDFNIGIKLICLIPFYILIYKLFEKPLYNRSLQYKEDINEAMGVMNNQFINVKITKINNWYKAYQENLNEYTNKAQNSFEKYCKVLFAFEGIDVIIKRLAMIIIISYSGSLVLRGRLSAGNFTIIIAYFNIAFEAIAGLIQFIKSLQDSRSSYCRVKELIETKCEYNGDLKLNEINEIKLEDISFRFDEDRLLINNLSRSFNKGKIYFIKGKNGIGKSTLFELITGLHRNYAGNIYFNDVNINKMNLYNFRTHLVSYVEQNPNLFDGTLYKNLTIGLEDYNINSIIEYCKEFGINEVFQGNYEALINGNNTNLSGGEKQKIIICRALGKSGDLILLDEPTSALDLKAKEKLKEIILRIKDNKIIIIITHDEEFLEIADEIVVLDDENLIIPINVALE